MHRDIRWQRPLLTLALLSILAGCFPVHSQDLIPISDITGGSTLFLARRIIKSATKKYTAVAKPQRSKTQRLETARKISRQYITIARVNPDRLRAKPIEPQNMPATIQGKEGSKMFAGLGEYYISEGNYDKAVEAFGEATQLDSESKEAKTGLSEAYALKGNDLLVKDRPDTAKAFFENALKYNPTNSAAYFGLGEVLSQLDKEDEAIKSYEKAFSINPKLTEIYVPLGILYYQKGDIAKADEILGKALAASADNPETQYFLGLVRYAQNRNEESLTAFRKSSALDPDYAEAYFYAGEALMRLGRKTEAVEEYKKAMALKQKYFDATLKLGTAYYELENYPEAIKVYTDAITLKNDSVDAYVGRGDTYRQMKEFNKAASDYNLALTFVVRDKKLSPDEASDIYLMHAYVIDRQCDINKVQALPCQWNAAIRSLEASAALTQRPEDYANLGAIYYKAGKFDKDRQNPDATARLEKARVNLERVLAVNPPVKFIDTPRFNLGLTLLDLNDYAGAIQQLQKVVDSLPDATYPLNELGAAYYESKNYKEAAKIFRKVIAKDDKSVRAYTNLALSEFFAGNTGEAKKAYEKLKLLSPYYANVVRVKTGGALK